VHPHPAGTCTGRAASVRARLIWWDLWAVARSRPGHMRSRRCSADTAAASTSSSSRRRRQAGVRGRAWATCSPNRSCCDTSHASAGHEAGVSRSCAHPVGCLAFRIVFECIGRRFVRRLLQFFSLLVLYLLLPVKRILFT
jgi:hypothetical protein